VAVNLPVLLILGDVGGMDAGRALVRLADNAPGGAFSAGDEIVLSGAVTPQNNGTFTVERIAGRDVYLNQTLLDEGRTRAMADLHLDGDRYEFLELKNTGVAPLNLSGVRFTAGIQYEFPEGTVLAPGRFWLLTPHRSNFRDRYPGVAVQGFYMGRLDNSGERLTLRDSFGNVITTVKYSDRAPWPESPDGLGRSLVPTQPNPTGIQDDMTEWRASRDPGGSPGADDPAAAVPSDKINECCISQVPRLSPEIASLRSQ
jgi:hypothetical protein